MIAAFLLAAVTAPAEPTTVRSALEAEYAFAADARRIGQWTAFSKWAAPGALMFVPQLVNAPRWLEGKKNPPQSVEWSPAVSYQSCDGKTAVNMGPWHRADGSFGYFTTVWQYEEELVDGPRWMWVYDGGDRLAKPMAARAKPKVRRASCHGIPATIPRSWAVSTLPPVDTPEPMEAAEHARDRSLRFEYRVNKIGNRHFAAWLWNGHKFEQVIYQTVSVTE
ncbi:MAG TPA: hypothetical protein VGM04_04030 [Sphingomicrobium sp.]